MKNAIMKIREKGVIHNAKLRMLSHYDDNNWQNAMEVEPIDLKKVIFLFIILLGTMALTPLILFCEICAFTLLKT